MPTVDLPGELARFSSLYLVLWHHNSIGRVNKLFKLLSSPLATFASCVIKVHVDDVREKPQKKWSIDQIFKRLGACGINPTHLFLLCRLRFASILPGPQDIFPSLVHLDIWLHSDYLNGDTVVEFRSLIDYVHAFPLLETLHIHGPGSEGSGWPKSTGLPPRLHTLRIDHPMVLRWLLQSPPKQPLTSLGIDHLKRWPEWDVPVINDFLASSAGAHVTKITLTEGQLDFGPNHRLEWRHLRSLKHLVIRQSHNYAPRSLLGLLADLRLSPTANNLETITLSVFRVITSYTRPDWCALDAVVADAASWPRLKAFIVALDHVENGHLDHRRERDFFDDRPFLEALASYAGVPLAEALRTDLAKCEKRGLLVVDMPVVHVREPVVTQTAPVRRVARKVRTRRY
ncbi:hypothetical protein C8R46DRAFT_1219923 [Mycena filopes]|nr:hypothetical protein C8R46DRAFT_1219923 [Mycena filopes]